MMIEPLPVVRAQIHFRGGTEVDSSDLSFSERPVAPRAQGQPLVLTIIGVTTHFAEAADDIPREEIVISTDMLGGKIERWQYAGDIAHFPIGIVCIRVADDTAQPRHRP